MSVVYVQDLQCGEPVEHLYYDADFQDICVYCCEDIPNDSTPKDYPQCEDCKDKQKIPRNKQKRNNMLLKIILYNFLFVV